MVIPRATRAIRPGDKSDSHHGLMAAGPFVGLPSTVTWWGLLWNDRAETEGRWPHCPPRL